MFKKSGSEKSGSLFVFLSLFLIFSPELFAGGYNFTPIELLEGKNISIDVVDYPKFAVLQVVAPKYKQPLAPTVTIQNENGFECDVYDNALSGYEIEYDPINNEEYFIGTWEIIIRWSPGADLSGCHVEVNMPQRQTSKVHLFMNE